MNHPLDRWSGHEPAVNMASMTDETRHVNWQKTANSDRRQLALGPRGLILGAGAISRWSDGRCKR